MRVDGSFPAHAESLWWERAWNIQGSETSPIKA